MWPLAALTEFSYKKMYERFIGTKKSGRNNEVGVRWGSTVFKFLITQYLFKYWWMCSK